PEKWPGRNARFPWRTACRFLFHPRGGFLLGSGTKQRSAGGCARVVASVERQGVRLGLGRVAVSWVVGGGAGHVCDGGLWPGGMGTPDFARTRLGGVAG